MTPEVKFYLKYVFVDVEPVLGWGLIIEGPVQLKGKFEWHKSFSKILELEHRFEIGL